MVNQFTAGTNPYQIALIDIPSDEMERIKFTVDSALLRELGERLVGKPYIALAELVKNSYDADATKVLISFGPDTIEVIDNGHGMDFSEFENYWMRVGSQHKQMKRFSRGFERPMTGSKGVGRLAVQFLARRILIRTVSDKDTKKILEAVVNWEEAVQAGELTEAEALYREQESDITFPEGKKYGTAIILKGLNQSWSSEEVVDLAKEIWPLQPPFQTASLAADDHIRAFKVELKSPDEEAVERFDKQMRAILDIWTARMVGRIVPGSRDVGDCDVNLVLEFPNGRKYSQEYYVKDCSLDFLQFEIRVYTLQRRQPFGIRVDEAREYFKRFGGVHVYDAGFHLPYYGTVESDWLRIQYDQASRIHKSQLLPEELQVSRGLQFLPTISRLFGVVHVNTSLEHQEAVRQQTDQSGDYLKIQVTRDRLVDNKAYQSLVRIVRWALDYYAMQEARRNLEELEAKRPIEPIHEKFERVDEILERYRENIPKPVFNTLKTEVKDAIEASQTESELLAGQLGLLGSLATAGMTALAYEHEAKKLHYQLLMITKQLEEVQVDDESLRKRLDEIIGRLYGWLDHSRAIRSLFSSLLDEESRTIEARFKARDLIREVSSQLGILMRGVKPYTYRLEETLRLPKARYAEWSAIFQNVFLNAVNAMLDSPIRRIDVSSWMDGRRRALLIQDTGVGVELESAEELFKPFERRLEISRDRKALGLGGSGLGLTIVRMIAENIGCSVSFVEPEDGYNTAFRIIWRETE